MTTPIERPADKRALLHALLDDLAAESADLDSRVAPLDDSGWATPTPAAGWDVRDTVNHLAATDEDALLALTDRAGFQALLGRLLAGSAEQHVERLVAQRRALPPADQAPLVALRGVDKIFANGTVALSGLELAIGRREFVSLLGPSGCGKSTALRLLAGLGRVSRGRIEWPYGAGLGDIGFVF